MNTITYNGLSTARENHFYCRWWCTTVETKMINCKCKTIRKGTFKYIFMGPCIVNQLQQDVTIYSVVIFSADSSTCFGWYTHPSSGAHLNCNCNIWHGSNRICYRLLSWRIRNCSSDSSTSVGDSKYSSTSARCCNYSLNVLLMMDEGIIRNM